jgi:phage tail tape-measure protein
LGLREGGAEDPRGGGLRARGEEALGDLAQALLDNPLFGQALSRALGAGERAAAAQRTAMGALNIPPASEVERLQQRLRSLSARLDDVEDRLDDLIDELAAMRRRTAEPTPQADAPPAQPTPQADEDVPATPSGN